MSTTKSSFPRPSVMIAVDPHKRSWTAAAVDARLQPLATIRVPVSRDGYRTLTRFARRWPDSAWAIEGASGLGSPLTVSAAPRWHRRCRRTGKTRGQSQAPLDRPRPKKR
jgi:hypothetical protein